MTTTAPNKALPEDREIEELAQSLDDALASARTLSPDASEVVDSVHGALNDVHRAALVHIVRTLREDPRGKELLFQLVDDPAVRMTMLMHGIIRPDPATLAQQALDGIRPQLQSHGGDVELSHIEDGVAYVRLSGACNGCSMAAVTMRDGVTEALTAGVPGVTSVEVLPNDPGPALIPLDQIGVRRSEPEQGWAKTNPIDHFALNSVTAVADESVIVVNVDGQLAAYVNECAHLSMPLDGAELDPTSGELTCEWHGYCFDALSGECRTLPGTQLEQIPLRVDPGDDGTPWVWIRTGS